MSKKEHVVVPDSLIPAQEVCDAAKYPERNNGIAQVSKSLKIVNAPVGEDFIAVRDGLKPKKREE